MDANSTPGAGTVYEGLVTWIEDSGIDRSQLHQAIQLRETQPGALNGCFFAVVNDRLMLSKNVYALIGGTQQEAGGTRTRSGTTAGSTS